MQQVADQLPRLVKMLYSIIKTVIIIKRQKEAIKTKMPLGVPKRRQNNSTRNCTLHLVLIEINKCFSGFTHQIGPIFRDTKLRSSIPQIKVPHQSIFVWREKFWARRAKNVGTEGVCLEKFAFLLRKKY